MEVGGGRLLLFNSICSFFPSRLWSDRVGSGNFHNDLSTSVAAAAAFCGRGFFRVSFCIVYYIHLYSREGRKRLRGRLL